MGGACLSKDPYILASVCRQVGVNPEFIIKGRSVNEHMPVHIVKRVYEIMRKAGHAAAGGTVFVLGFAFKGKPETSDMRDSPTLDLVQELHSRNARILGHDPLVSTAEIEALGVQITSLEEGFKAAQIVIIMIDHPLYADLDIASLATRSKQPLVIMDGWHLYDANSLKKIDNLTYLRI